MVSLRYTRDGLMKILELAERENTNQEIADEMDRTVASIKRLLYILNKAKSLSGEERREHFERNRVSVKLFEGVLDDYFGDDGKVEEREDSLVTLNDKVEEARELFENALLDYVVAGTKAIQKTKLKKIRKTYKKRVKKLEKKVEDLGKVVEQAKKSNLSYNLKKRLLGGYR